MVTRPEPQSRRTTEEVEVFLRPDNNTFQHPRISSLTSLEEELLACPFRTQQTDMTQTTQLYDLSQAEASHPPHFLCCSPMCLFKFYWTIRCRLGRLRYTFLLPMLILIPGNYTEYRSNTIHIYKTAGLHLYISLWGGDTGLLFDI